MQINRASARDAIMKPDLAQALATWADRIRKTERMRPRAASRETVMIRKQYRIVLATLCVFITLASLAGVVHALLFDDGQIFRYAIVALVSSILAFVALLNPTVNDRP